MVVVLLLVTQEVPALAVQGRATALSALWASWALMPARPTLQCQDWQERRGSRHQGQAPARQPEPSK